MKNSEIAARFRALEAELDLLRARSDALSIALKHTICNSHDPHAVYAAVMNRLEVSNVEALYSATPTETYVRGFEIAVQAIARWRNALPPAAP